MMVVGTVIVLAIFLFVGWAVSTEMFQHRAWRKRVESGDVDIVGALIQEAMGSWRRARPPKELPSGLWAGVQGAQLVAVTADSATVSTSADAEFQTEGGRRVQVASSLEQAIAVAARLIDMMLYDVPNLRLSVVRVDVYSTFTESDGQAVQKPILSATAERAVADDLTWEALTPAEILSRFDATYERTAGGQAVPIELAPVEGTAPAGTPSPTEAD
jgi:hypothetical protein